MKTVGKTSASMFALVIALIFAGGVYAEAHRVPGQP
jgi:hypothetical protein